MSEKDKLNEINKILNKYEIQWNNGNQVAFPAIANEIRKVIKAV